MNIDKINPQDHLLEGFCRGCLIKYDNPTDVLHYTEKNRRLFVYSTGLQVKRNDTFAFQLCKDCYVNMKFSCKFKKQCRASDKRFKSYLRLREVSDIDLCTFLKNSDDTLKFPLLSGSSTPAFQRNKDDDNESTCTSIQNFMTDILQGTEMPDTEARIIKEVIEEEADVLEDSLDSHWLQDDVSIDTDFRLDLSFSPFSTSRSVNNNVCYTPLKDFESNQNNKNNHAKQVLEQLPTLPENYLDSPKDISINGINEALRDICGKSQIDIEEDYMQDNLKEECINANEVIPMFVSDPNMPELTDERETNFPVHSEIDIAVKNIDMNFGCVQVNEEHFDELNDQTVNNKNFYVLNDLAESEELKVDKIVEHQKDYNILSDVVIEQNTTECSIDKKLKQALENNNEEITLEDLLVSPAPEAVSTPKIYDLDKPKLNEMLSAEFNDFPKTTGVATPTITAFADGAGASTPMINEILFGDKLELDANSNSSHRVGQCIEKFEDVGGDIDMLEDFFNEGVKEFDQNENSDPATETNVTDTEAPDIKDDLVNTENYNIEKGLCKICDKEYKTEKAIKSHMVKIHQIKIPKKKYVDDREKVCPHCGMIIKDRGNFFRHVKIHEKASQLPESYRCKVCTLTFSSQSSLNQHGRVHNVLRATEKKKMDHKYICSVCGVTFALATNLATHARRHAAPALACGVCGKGFHTNHELQRHERVHSGERPHKCPVDECSKSFKTKYSLVTHMRKHTAEKPFQCDHCSIKFSKKGNLVKHIKTSKKCTLKREGIKKQKRERTFSCFFCQQKYTTKGRLIKHQERSSSCVKMREDMQNMNRSTIKVQMPFLYPNTPNTEVTPAPMFTIRVLGEEQVNTS